MKYLNHLNAIIAVVGVLVIGNTLLQTFWQPGSPKRPTVNLTTGKRPVKSGINSNTSMAPNQGRRPSGTVPSTASPLGANRVSQSHPSPATRPGGVSPSGGVAQPGGFGIPGGTSPSPAPAASGVIGQPGGTGRVMDYSGSTPSGDPTMLEESPGGKRVPPRRLNSNSGRSGDPRSMYMPPPNRGAKRDQQQSDPNAPAPPPRSSMPQ